MDILFLDYRKVFDSVSYKRLIEKLRSFVIKGQLSNWIEDFLKLRTTKVMIPSLKEVLSGVVVYHKDLCLGRFLSCYL